MKFSRKWISVVPMACVAAILMSAIMGCQQTDAKKAAMDSKQLEPQTASKTATSEATADTSMKGMDMKGMKMPANAPAKEADAGYWTCTMHPEIHQAGPGNCPKCGMTLVFKKTDKIPTK